VEILIILIYAVILGLVAPYLTTQSREYGVLLPPAIAAVAGSVLWIVLTWLDFKHAEAWIWIIVMAVMPIAMVIVSQRIAAHRRKTREAAKAN
jgi:uncharacterized membrane protein YeaQ/YmgE (transglycosylase-associated protein family)